MLNKILAIFRTASWLLPMLSAKTVSNTYLKTYNKHQQAHLEGICDFHTLDPTCVHRDLISDIVTCWQFGLREEIQTNTTLLVVYMGGGSCSVKFCLEKGLPSKRASLSW